jgi:hypothetical protein
MNELVLIAARTTLPAIIAAAGERASLRFLEFFAANIRNPHTRRAYSRAVSEFMTWCEDTGVTSITAVQPLHVSATSRPRTASVSLSMATRGWMKNPAETPSPAAPSPRRLAPRPAKLISVVSCATTMCRRAVAASVLPARVASISRQLTDGADRGQAYRGARVLITDIAFERLGISAAGNNGGAKCELGEKNG